jgi:hypothetical protein
MPTGRVATCRKAVKIGNLNQKGDEMDSSTIIRVVSGTLFLVVLGILIWRRKKTA